MTIKVGSNFYNFPGFFKNSTIKVGSLVISASDAMMCINSLAALVILGLSLIHISFWHPRAKQRR